MNRFLLKLLIILVIVFLAWATFVPREPFSEETVLFKIEKGEGSRDIAFNLEKEVQTKEDKEMVSGIFWKRVKAGVPLQSCASIAYIKGVPQWRYSFEDTRIESPYNTYLYYGLPPGPISNPGLDSIEAAIYPKDSLYWYYLSTLEGETIYSRTLDEHNAATAKYLR